MGVFLPTINQMGFLMLLIFIGYIIVRLKVVQSEGTVLLSRLEQNIFVPALTLDTFIKNLTIDKLSVAWQYFVSGTILMIVMIFVALIISKWLTKDKYLQNILAYGFAFANFGFMGIST